MPLLHKAAYQFKSVPSDLKPDDEVFHIRASKEVFRTYEEYIAKAYLYTKEIWSCSLTGKSNLTLEEAIESEEIAREKLKKFPEVLEKPTLLLAHHSHKNLDWMASTIITQYKAQCAVGESVTVNVGDDQKRGKVLECVTSLDAAEGDEDLYTYKIQLSDSSEILTDISHTKLERQLQLPTKELIKLFIREHTIKQSNMFNVKRDMLIKYNIPHKFATITSVLRCTPVADKKKTPTQVSKKSTPKAKTPQSAKSKGKMIKIHSVGDDGRLITTWKEVPPKPSLPAHVQDEAVITITDTDSEPEKKQLTPNSEQKAKKPPLTEEQKKERRQKRIENKEVKEFTAKIKGLIEKYKDQLISKNEEKKKNETDKKQTSLLKYLDKSSISSTIRELLTVEENGYRRSMMINDLAKSMTTNVSNKLPLATPVKTLLLEKREKLLEREKVAKMSPKKREEYFQQKEELRIAELQRRREEKMKEQQKLKEERLKQREEEREAVRQARLAQMALERIIIDDLSLGDSTPLPPYIPVEMPEGHTVDSFPKAALVVSAIHYFRHVFTLDDDDTPYTSDLLLNAASEGPKGHKVLSTLLISMLNTLRQETGDRVRVRLLDIPLSTVDLSEYNIGACLLEYIRYLLTHSEYEGTELEEIADSLEKAEFYDLQPYHKIHVMYIMCEEIIQSKTFNQCIQANLEDTTRVRRELQIQQTLRNKQIHSEMLAKMQNNLREGLGGTVTNKNDKNGENGVKDAEEGQEEEEDGDEGIGSEDEEDLATVVKQRRENLKKQQELREEQRLKREAERIKEQKFKEQQAAILGQRKKEEVLRNEIERLLHSITNESLGLDRNYCRYWLFTSDTPGLFIEQGWWGERYFSPVQTQGEHSNTASSNTTDSNETSDKQPQLIVPDQRAHMWYCVPTLSHYDEMKKALNRRGSREKHLLMMLNKEDERIRTAIRRSEVNPRPHRFIGNVEATINALKKDVQMMNNSLGYAGLGGVENIIRMIKPDLCSVSQCGSAMLALQASVDAKYMKKPLASTDNNDLTFTYHPNVQVWKDLVEDSSTYSQLHMLLSVFDNCIKWEKSIEKINCKVCKKKGDERKLLICDHCDAGYHCGCLRPPLKKVPAGDWLCPSCRPLIEEDSDSGECSEEAEEEEEEETNDDFCCICEYGGELILCDKCPSAYHMICHDPPLKRVPRGDWACFKCMEGAAPSSTEDEDDPADDDEEGEESEESDDEIENCRVCGKGGKLLQCSECTQTYHMRCHDPPLKVIPGSKWKCINCKGPFKTKKRSKNQKSNGTKKRKVEKTAPKKRTISESDDEVIERKYPSRSRRSRDIGGAELREAASSSSTRAERSNRRNIQRGIDSNIEICEDIISDLLKIPESADFIDLVDKKRVPDYYDIIEKPICLSQIKEKTLYLQYETVEEFINDMVVLLENCFAYNLEQSEVYENGKVLKSSFLSMVKSRLPSHYKTIRRSL